MDEAQASATPMRLGILQCDVPSEDLRQEFGDYGDMFCELLSSGPHALTCRKYDLTRGEFPASVGDCDAWLFTGSTWSVYDPDDWIAQAHELVRELDAARRPTVGACFGHQLIARALGGRVAAAEAGWGVGVHHARVTEQRPWMQPVRENLPLLVSHMDQVQELPAGASVLASHAFCPYDMFQVGEHILTFQGHPEFDKGYVRALIERRRARIGKDTAAAGLESLNQPVEGAVAGNWIQRFLAAARARG